MSKLTEADVRNVSKRLVEDTVEGLCLIADAARHSKIKPEEAKSLDAGERKLKGAFATLIETLSPLQNSNFRTTELAAYVALQDLMLGAYAIGSRGVIEEERIIDGFAVSAGRTGGRASVKARRKEAGETWEPHARCLALEVTEADPGVSANKLATKIQSGWRLNMATPAHSTLRKFISEKLRVEGKA